MHIDFHNSVRSALCWLRFSDGSLGTHSSMIVFKVHPVVPTRALWLFMMFLIGLFGLIAQVCSSTFSSSTV
jgi:hypothetical protein